MANTPCCQLVGNLELEQFPGCIISVNVSSRLEVIKECGNTILTGATTGSISIVGYAAQSIHTGCPGRAGVSVNWMKRLDCDEYKTYFLSTGQGPSYLAGDTNALINGREESLAVLNNSTGRAYPTINASSSSGPASIYMKTNQTDGYGLVYIGSPIAFDTSIKPDITNPLNGTRTMSINGQTIRIYSSVLPNMGIGAGPMYLQNFSLEMTPGELPTASYSFAFFIEDENQTEIELFKLR